MVTLPLPGCKVAISTGTGKPNTVPTQSGPFGPANQTRALVLSGLGRGWPGAGSRAWPATAPKSNRPRRPAEGPPSKRCVTSCSFHFHFIHLPFQWTETGNRTVKVFLLSVFPQQLGNLTESSKQRKKKELSRHKRENYVGIIASYHLWNEQNLCSFFFVLLLNLL